MGHDVNTLAAFAVFCGIFVVAPAQAGDLPSPVTDDMYAPTQLAEVELGQLLFWDPILSGNRNIACGTCHHPEFATSDGMSLGIGEGGIGIGPARQLDAANPPEDFIPRNAPALFNLGARDFTVMFHDGRVETDPRQPSGIRSPMGAEMLDGFSGILSAQTMFPVLSADEMAGQFTENDVARAVRMGLITGPGGAWDILSQRVSENAAYRAHFADAYPDIAAGRAIGFSDISNAIAAFIAFEWRSDTAPFDAVLRGQHTLTGGAARGMDLFYGAAHCSTCHSGPFQTDHGFHAMGVPQFGPGKAASFETHQRDEGRMEVTGRPEDAFKFRTPSLRNVAFTAPYGHTGAFVELSEFLKFHADPVGQSKTYVAKVQLTPGMDHATALAPLSDAGLTGEILAAVSTPPLALDDADIAALTAFLQSLSDPAAVVGRLGIPLSVPSGLPVDR